MKFSFSGFTVSDNSGFRVSENRMFSDYQLLRTFVGLPDIDKKDFHDFWLTFVSDTYNCAADYYSELFRFIISDMQESVK